MSLLDPILTFFNQSQKNLAKLLRMEKQKFWCIFAEIDPLYDVIMGGAENVQKSPFSTLIGHFSANLNELGKHVKNVSSSNFY